MFRLPKTEFSATPSWNHRIKKKVKVGGNLWRPSEPSPAAQEGTPRAGGLGLCPDSF